MTRPQPFLFVSYILLSEFVKYLMLGGYCVYRQV